MRNAHTLNIQFSVGLLANGKYAAAHTSEPYFCFSGNSEAEVVGIATRALNFFFCSEGESSKTVSVNEDTRRSSSKFLSSKTFRVEEAA